MFYFDRIHFSLLLLLLLIFSACVSIPAHKALLGAKADLSIKNGEGLTCVDLAQQEKNNLALDMFAALEHQQPQEQHEGNDHEQE